MVPFAEPPTKSAGKYDASNPFYARSISAEGSWVVSASQTLSTFDITDPARPKNTQTLAGSGNEYDVAVAGGRAYFVNGQSGYANYALGTQAPIATSTGFYGNNHYAHIVTDGDSAWVAGGAVSQFSIADTPNMEGGGTYSINSVFIGLALVGSDKLATFGNRVFQPNSHTLTLWNRVGPSPLGTLDIDGFTATHAVSAGTKLYLSGGSSGIAVVDISNPAQPRHKRPLPRAAVQAASASPATSSSSPTASPASR